MIYNFRSKSFNSPLWGQVSAGLQVSLVAKSRLYTLKDWKDNGHSILQDDIVKISERRDGRKDKRISGFLDFRSSSIVPSATKRTSSGTSFLPDSLFNFLIARSIRALRASYIASSSPAV